VFCMATMSVRILCFLCFTTNHLLFCLRHSRALSQYSCAFPRGWVQIFLLFMTKCIIGRFLHEQPRLKTPKSPETLGFLHRKSTHELYHFVSTLLSKTTKVDTMKWEQEGVLFCDCGLPPVFVPTSELVKTVSWHPHSFIGLATS